MAKLLLIAGLLMLLGCEGYFGWRLHTLSGRQEQVKKDYADVNPRCPFSSLPNLKRPCQAVRPASGIAAAFK
jgi:hypothetical protein